ncbi:MAG: hypothetical protein V4555_05805 [Acidobacteriota bacterium]
MLHLRPILTLALLLLLATHLPAQTPQSPSPMVEHTRPHPRLTKTEPAGARKPLELGTLFIPTKLPHKHTARLLFFFHRGDWLPQLAATENNVAVITIQAGAGSGTYVKLFADPNRFPALIASAEYASGLTFTDISLAGWSAGCGALRQILSDPTSYARVHRVLCIDGVHAGYTTDTPDRLNPQLVPENLAPWLHFGRDAIAGNKRLIITHSEIFPGTYASTTETADELLREWNLTPHAVVRWGPMKTQMLSETRAHGILVVGFAGNSAPDHVDQFQSLPQYLHWLYKNN